ncbi:hypothetical protein SDC9_160485 [bioreactor metagenome]|uniref:Uncharacterized protein n=1 Tax=bioreactor metagenome TaxID=1076179 RepID=A0A645FFI8_9ZZZZ
MYLLILLYIQELIGDDYHFCISLLLDLDILDLGLEYCYLVLVHLLLCYNLMLSDLECLLALLYNLLF